MSENPIGWSLRHRLSRIFSALGRKAEALQEARTAVELDPAQFVALSSLVSLLLDMGVREEVETHISTLRELAADREQRHVVDHLRARTLYQASDLEGALRLVERQIARNANLAASYGLKAQIKLAEVAMAAHPRSATARLALEQAEVAVDSCESQQDHEREVVSSLRARIATLRRD